MMPKYSTTSTQEYARPRRLHEHLFADHLKVFSQNARHILGRRASTREVQDLARQSTAEYVRAWFFSHFPRSHQVLAGATAKEGLEYFHEALDTHGRVVLVAPHMAYASTWRNILPHLFPPRTFFVTFTERDVVLSKDAPGRHLHGIIDRLKEGRPDERRHVVFLNGDRADLSPDGQSVTVSLFGAPVRFPSGPAVIARMTNTPIIPATFVRREEGFLLRFNRPILVDADNEEEAIQQATQTYADVFADGIREFPEQWPMYRHDYWPDSKDFAG